METKGLKLTWPFLTPTDVRAQFLQPVPVPPPLQLPTLHHTSPSTSTSCDSVPETSSGPRDASMPDGKKSQHQQVSCWAWHGASRGVTCARLRWVAGIGKAEMAIVSLCHPEPDPPVDNVVVNIYISSSTIYFGEKRITSEGCINLISQIRPPQHLAPPSHAPSSRPIVPSSSPPPP